MADVEALCKRVIVIHHGKLLFDGDLAGLVARFAPHKTIVVDLVAGADDPTAALQRAMDDSGGHVVEHARERITVQVPRAKTALVTTRLLAELPVVDLVVEEPAVDDVIDQVFAVPAEEAAAAAAEAAAAADTPAPSRTSPPLPDDAARTSAPPVRHLPGEVRDRARGAVRVSRCARHLAARSSCSNRRSTWSSGRPSRTARVARSAGSPRASSRATSSC